jgi:nucleoside-diphosphate-sugar epimerase
LINKIKNKDVIELNVDGKPIINPITLSDAAEATVKAIKTTPKFNIFNIGGSEQASILQIVNIIEKQTGKKVKIKYNNNKIEDMVVDITKMKEILRFKPKINLEEGIREMIER